jgi:hypothetical protein
MKKFRLFLERRVQHAAHAGDEHGHPVALEVRLQTQQDRLGAAAARRLRQTPAGARIEQPVQRLLDAGVAALFPLARIAPIEFFRERPHAGEDRTAMCIGDAVDVALADLFGVEARRRTAHRACRVGSLRAAAQQQQARDHGATHRQDTFGARRWRSQARNSGNSDRAMVP